MRTFAEAAASNLCTGQQAIAHLAEWPTAAGPIFFLTGFLDISAAPSGSCHLLAAENGAGSPWIGSRTLVELTVAALLRIGMVGKFLLVDLGGIVLVAKTDRLRIIFRQLRCTALALCQDRKRNAGSRCSPAY